MDIPAIKRIVFSEEAISQKVCELGRQITEDYRGLDLVLLSVLKGTIYFFADLTRQITLSPVLDFISLGVYPGNQAGVVRIAKDLDVDIAGRHVVMVEDIIRTGLTTGYLVSNLESRKPASIRLCTLLDCPAQRLVCLPIAYRGFEVEDTWLMGYGMDIRESGRNLPYIAEVDKA